MRDHAPGPRAGCDRLRQQAEDRPSARRRAARARAHCEGQGRGPRPSTRARWQSGCQARPRPRTRDPRARRPRCARPQVGYPRAGRCARERLPVPDPAAAHDRRRAGDRRVDGRNRSHPRGSGGAARRLPRRGHRAAHARAVHTSLRPAARQALRGAGEGSRERRSHPARACPHRAGGRAAHGGLPQRGAVVRAPGRGSAGSWRARCPDSR